MGMKLKITYNAPVTLTFVLICLGALLLGFLTNGWTTLHLFSTYAVSLFNPFSYLCLVLHIFGHIDFGHFISNAMCLLLLGPMLEEKYGRKTLSTVIIATALVTGLVHCVLFPLSALCGASGVVFAFIVMSSFTTFQEGEIPLSFVLVVLIYLGSEVYSGIAVSDNISNLTHIIGGVVGGGAGYLLNRSDRAVEKPSL